MRLLDTNVVIDCFGEGAKLQDWAAGQIARAVREDGAAINPVALAEASLRLDIEDVKARLKRMGVQFVPLPIAASGPAARAFAIYLQRRKSDAPPPRIPLPDFFIGAHAEAEAWTVVTHDAARFRTYFPKVKIIAPAK